MLNRVQNRRYGLLLLIQMFLFFITPLALDHPYLFFLFLFGLFGILGSAILTVWKARLPRLLAIVSAVTAIATGFMAFPGLKFEEPVSACLAVCAAAYSLFLIIAIVSIGTDVLFRERVTLDCILGSISVYLFLGILFAFLFGFVSLFLPGSLHCGQGSAGTVKLNELLYFSYSTLTTTGYGDITPTHPFVRSLAMFESVAGTLYVALMISRLVSLLAADRGVGAGGPSANREVLAGRSISQ